MNDVLELLVIKIMIFMHMLFCGEFWKIFAKLLHGFRTTNFTTLMKYICFDFFFFPLCTWCFCVFHFLALFWHARPVVHNSLFLFAKVIFFCSILSFSLAKHYLRFICLQIYVALNWLHRPQLLNSKISASHVERKTNVAWRPKRQSRDTLREWDIHVHETQGTKLEEESRRKLWNMDEMMKHGAWT